MVLTQVFHTAVHRRVVWAGTRGLTGSRRNRTICKTQQCVMTEQFLYQNMIYMPFLNIYTQILYKCNTYIKEKEMQQYLLDSKVTQYLSFTWQSVSSTHTLSFWLAQVKQRSVSTDKKTVCIKIQVFTFCNIIQRFWQFWVWKSLFRCNISVIKRP